MISKIYNSNKIMFESWARKGKKAKDISYMVKGKKYKVKRKHKPVEQSQDYKSIKERYEMGLQDMIFQKVLKKIDITFGKKFKVVDEVTDLFQGAEGRIDDLEERINKLEERTNENKHAGQSKGNPDK